MKVVTLKGRQIDHLANSRRGASVVRAIDRIPLERWRMSFTRSASTVDRDTQAFDAYPGSLLAPTFRSSAVRTGIARLNDSPGPLSEP